MTDSERQRYLNSYNESFIMPAHPFRFNTETKTIPRVRDLRQVNLKADIERKWRAVFRPDMWGDLRHMHPDDVDRLWELADEQQLEETSDSGAPLFFKQPIRYYRRLDSRSERTGRPYIAHHMFGKARSQNTNLKWYLVQHDRDADVNYLQFDLDMHGEWSSHAWSVMQEHVSSIEKVVASLGGEVVWTTSPGDVYGGKHVQGLYAWIKLDDFHKVGQLIDSKKRVKRILDLPEDTECSWDHAYRAIRLGGQQYVELVNPHTMDLISPVTDDEPQRKAFEAFCEAWHNAKPISLDSLLALAPKPVGDTQAVISWQPAVARKPKKQEQPAPPQAMNGPAKKIANENTWQTALKTVSETMHRHRGSVSLAIDEAVRILPERCHMESRTCHDPQALRGLVGRIARHFSKNFCPRNKRRAVDQDRYRRHTIDADIEDVIKVLRRHLPINGLKNKLRRYLRALKAKGGRLDCTSIYDDPDAIFAKREWFRLNGRTSDLLCIDPDEEDSDPKMWLSNFICVIDDSDHTINKCRQYGFSPLLIKELKKVKAARQRAQAILNSCAEINYSPLTSVSISRTPTQNTTSIASGVLDTESSKDGNQRAWRVGRWNSILGCLPDL